MMPWNSFTSVSGPLSTRTHRKGTALRTTFLHFASRHFLHAFSA